MDPIQEEIQSGLKEAFKGSVVDTTGSEFKNIITPQVEAAPVENSLTNPVVEKPAVEVPAVETQIVEAPAVEAPVVDAPIIENAVSSKSFEDQVAEKTGGKFKTWEEIESVLSAPKEELDEELKHWQDLKNKGVKFDAEFFELQSKDFASMDNPLDIRMEAMRRHPDYAGLSDKTIEIQLDKKYNLSEWIDKDDTDLTDEDIANREILMRDAYNDREWLVNFKNERVFAKTPDPKQLEQRAESERLAQENWEKFVDEELVNKTSKLSTKISDKESVDFEVSDADKKYAADMMKSMTKDISVFWKQFEDKDGKMNQKAVYDMILYWKNKDNIVKVAHQNAEAKGKESEVKAIKNISFEANPTPTTSKVDWRAKAQEQVEKNL